MKDCNTKIKNKKNSNDDDGEPQQEFTYKQKTPRKLPKPPTGYSKSDDYEQSL